MHNPTLQITKERLRYSRLGVFQECKIDLRLEKSSHVIHYINRIEGGKKSQNHLRRWRHFKIKSICAYNFRKTQRTWNRKASLT